MKALYYALDGAIINSTINLLQTGKDHFLVLSATKKTQQKLLTEIEMIIESQLEQLTHFFLLFLLFRR